MDWGFDDFPADEPSAPVYAERQIVPEGTHAFQITRVAENDTNLTVVLAHDDKAISWVWVSLPKDKDWAARIVGTLARSLGLSPAEWKATEAGDLVGRRLEAEIYHRLGNNGKTFANVRKFLPPQEAAPAKRTPARSQAAKAHADFQEEAGTDAIPF